MSVLVLAMIPALGLVLYIAWEDRQRETDEARRQILRLIELTAMEDAELIDGTRQLMVILAQYLQAPGADPAERGPFLARLLEQYRRYDNFGLAGTNGDVICSATPLPGPVNVGDRDYFQTALRQRTFAVGHYQVGRITGKRSINFGYPVRNRVGQVQGVAFAALSLDWLNRSEAGDRWRLYPGATFARIDEEGIILVRHPEPEKWVGKPWPEATLVQAVFTQRHGVMERAEAGGEPQYQAFASGQSPLHTGAMGVILSIPKKVLFAGPNRVLTRNLIWLGAIALAVLGVIWIGTDLFVLRCVKALILAANRLAAGDLSVRAALPCARGEVGQLARAFDEMAASLEQREAERKQSELRNRAFLTLEERLNASASVSEAANIIVEVADRLLGWDACFVGLYSPEREIWELVLRMDTVNGQKVGIPWREPGPPGPLARRVLHEEAQLILRNKNEAPQPGLEPFGDEGRPSASLMFAPMRIGERVVGLLSIQSYTPQAYTAEDLKTLQALADHCSSAIDRARAQEALRASEERLRFLLTASPAVIYSCGASGDYPCTFISQNVKEQLGYEPSAFTKKADFWAERIHPEDKPRVFCDLRRLFDGGAHTHEYRFRHQDGTYRWMRDELRLVRDAAGQPQEIVGFWIDITERKRAEEALRQLSGRLLQLQDEERRRLARDLHDTTAQNLAALVLNLNVLHTAASELNAKTRQILDDCLTLADQCADEIRTLAYLLHPPVLDDLGLAGAVRDCADGFARRSGIRVDLELPADLGRLPREMEMALFRVLQESLANIHRHSGSPTASIRLKRAAREICLEVRDSGHGMRRTGGAASDDSSARTLGVGIVGMRERLRQLGGYLKIESGRGGTTIQAILPLEERTQAT